MSKIVTKTFSNLFPVQLLYNFNQKDTLLGGFKIYNDGFVTYELDGTLNFKDTTTNKSTCLVLTSSISLKQFFDTNTNLKIGELTTSIYLQPRGNTVYFAKYDANSNTIQLSLNEGTPLLIQQAEQGKVEIIMDGKYLEIEGQYPYTAFLNERKQGQNLRERQLFNIFYDNNLITIRNFTNAGYRYLAFNNDNILRCTGLVLNDLVVNDYVFKCIPVTNLDTNYGFIPTNNWVTYYYDVEVKKDNKTLTINKDIQDTKINYLMEFSYPNAIKTGKASINLINLKTGITPAGSPGPVENSYIKQVTTTN